MNPEAYVNDWFDRVGYGQQVTSKQETIGFGGFQQVQEIGGRRFTILRSNSQTKRDEERERLSQNGSPETKDKRRRESRESRDEQEPDSAASPRGRPSP